MRRRTELVGCAAVVALVTLAAIEPRFHQLFPSLIDDWNAIAYAPDQLRDVVRLGNPERVRYRPGFIAWNALQWHTLGAPGEFVGPLLWGVLRWLVLVLGTTLLVALLLFRSGERPHRTDVRWLLVVAVPLVMLTPQSLAIDVARYGPQEPLLVGCMALGAILLVRGFDGLLDMAPTARATIVSAGSGLVLWAFGTMQKETSICVLVLAPFLWPTLRSQRARWAETTRGRRVAIGVVAGAALLPVALMAGWTFHLSRADERFYEGASAGKSFSTRLSEQLTQADDVLHTPLPMLALVAAAVLLSVRAFRVGTDWLSAGLLLTALAFIVFAAEVGVVASRYYLPAFVLGGAALARCAAAVGSRTALATGLIVAGGALWQAWDGRHWVEWWVDTERDQEVVVREAQARAAGGCRVEVIGLNVEFARAVPVLMPLADEQPRDCRPGGHFVVVVDQGGPGTGTPPTHPVLAACAPDPTPAWSSYKARILRCTA